MTAVPSGMAAARRRVSSSTCCAIFAALALARSLPAQRLSIPSAALADSSGRAAAMPG